MRKGILSLLFVLTTLSSFANINVENHPTEVFGFENRYNDDAVTFFERGIRFHVFLNGDFDFDSRFYRTRRNRRVPILRNWQGRISRVGNVRIRYDFRGNVRRIGRITINYRRGWLSRVGNLTVDYNRYGDPFFYGNVGFDDFYNDYYYGNSWNVNIGAGFNWNVGAVCVYNDPFFYGNEFRNSYRRVREDNNYIYYRANNGSTVSRDRILRRRKPSSSNGQSVTGRRDGNTNTATNARRRSVQNSSINNNRRRSVQSSSTNTRRNVQGTSTNNRRRNVQSTSTNNRRRNVQSTSTNNRRNAQSTSTNNRRRSQVNTSQSRRKNVVRDESSRKRSSQVNRTTQKKREIRNTNSSKRTKKEVKRRRS